MKVTYKTVLYFFGVAAVAAGFAVSFNPGTGLIAFGVGFILYSIIRGITD